MTPPNRFYRSSTDNRRSILKLYQFSNLFTEYLTLLLTMRREIWSQGRIIIRKRINRQSCELFQNWKINYHKYTESSEYFRFLFQFFKQFITASFVSPSENDRTRASGMNQIHYKHTQTFILHLFPPKHAEEGMCFHSCGTRKFMYSTQSSSFVMHFHTNTNEVHKTLD